MPTSANLGVRDYYCLIMLAPDPALASPGSDPMGADAPRQASSNFARRVDTLPLAERMVSRVPAIILFFQGKAIARATREVSPEMART